MKSSHAPAALDPAVQIQRGYYARTAAQYDSMHAHEGADDTDGRNLVASMLRSVGVRSLLDVGSGTGRGPFGIGGCASGHTGLRRRTGWCAN
jgi:ubiquinone/menaquinone biosynthesis C-methylase UbiE